MFQLSYCLLVLVHLLCSCEGWIGVFAEVLRERWYQRGPGDPDARRHWLRSPRAGVNNLQLAIGLLWINKRAVWAENRWEISKFVYFNTIHKTIYSSRHLFSPKISLKIFSLPCRCFPGRCLAPGQWGLGAWWWQSRPRSRHWAGTGAGDWGKRARAGGRGQRRPDTPALHHGSIFSETSE